MFSISFRKHRIEKKEDNLLTLIVDLRDTGAMLYQLTLLPMCGFIAQLVEHRTGIAEVMGSNPVEALIFSGFYFPIA